MDRIRDPETASPNVEEYRVIESVETPDDTTVVFRLSDPYAPFLATLASGWSAIMPAHLIDQGHNFAVDPVGTGPFLLRSWIPDTRIILDKNPGYWMERAPVVDQVRINIITETAVQEQGITTGQLDLVDMITETNLPLLRDHPRTRVETTLSSLVMVLVMNTRREPFTDPVFRRAVAHAIDKQRVLDLAYAGGETVTTFMDAGDPYYAGPDEIYPFNPDQAARLLEETAYSSDEVLKIVVPQNYEPHMKAAEIYQQMLHTVGIQTEIQPVEWSAWLQDVYYGGSFDITVIGHTGKLDPDGRLSLFARENNYTGWYDSDLTETIQRARRETDESKRRKMYRKVQETLAQEVPMVFVGTSYRHIGVARNLKELHIDTKLDTFDFRSVYLE
jgi:peptide/nickel transport system substrate-binding protein